MNETEEEQVEAIKKWWSENGRAIVLGVVIGGGVILAWRSWGGYQVQQAETASNAYQSILVEFSEGNSDAVNTAGSALRSEYGSTPYAALASLLSAKMAVESGNLDAAIEALQWAMDNSPEEDIRHIATMRLARVISAQGKFSEALTLLDKDFPEAFKALLEELRGDVLLAQGNDALAHDAYTRALAVEQSQGNAALLQMKLDDIAVAKRDS